jgi:hypothetical protein
MQATIDYDTTLRQLLQPLLGVRHPHLRPLRAVRISEGRMALHYGRAQECAVGCDGIRGALQAIHAAGLWIGNVLESIGLDERGRVVFTGVGSNWDLRDPFAGHPSVTGYDLRVKWRQRGDDLQLSDLEGELTRCAA